MKNTSTICFAAMAAILALPAAARAAIVTLNAEDTVGISSFVNGTNWSDTTAPNGANTYEVNVAGRRLRTPTNGTSNSFGGASLTLNGGILFLKGNNATTTTVSSLLVNGGGVNLESNDNLSTVFLAGGITIQSGGLTFNSTSGSTLTLGVTASIGGSGSLTQTFGGFGPTTVNLQSANSYAGGTLVTKGTLGAQVNGSLGTGNITVSGGANAGNRGTLTLGTGTSSSNYIDNLAQLILTSGTANPIVNLNFTGQDTVGSINYFGTLLDTAGTYGAVGSGSNFELAEFQGTGQLLIVPEPSAILLVGLGAAGMLLRRRRARIL